MSEREPSETPERHLSPRSLGKIEDFTRQKGIDQNSLAEYFGERISQGTSVNKLAGEVGLDPKTLTRF